MLNLNELETQWLRYKIKSYIPHFIITISLSSIILSLIFLDFSFKNTLIQESNTSDISELNSTIEIIPPIKKPQITIENNEDAKKLNIDTIDSPTQISPPAPHTKSEPIILPTIPRNDKKLLIRPSLDFLRNMKGDSPAYYNAYPIITDTYKKPPLIKNVKATKIEEIVLDTQVIEKKETKIKIQRQNTQEDIQHVVKRFKKSNNPALSLFIAKKYYDLKNYNQSYNYALITNEINNDIEDSWMLFAKSLYKLKKKDKALAVLKKYIATSHSQRAKILLDNIKSGKIK